MWNSHLLGKAPGGQAAVGQAQMGGHVQASVAAHAAATHAKARMALGGAGGQPSFKQHIASTLTSGGIPTTPQDVHNTIGAMTQAGHFTPQQGAGLQAHNGMLHGPQGLATIAKIGAATAQAKQPAPMGMGAGTMTQTT